jgi:hypothetical protein
MYQYGTNFEFWYAGVNIIATGVIANTWYHVAATRSGTTVRLFINGVQAGGNATSSLNYPNSNFRIGMDSDGLYPFVGYISNVRAVNSTALYTANFTPPTAPLTAITNTSLLTCQTNQPHNNSQFLDSSTNNFLITRNGNTTQGSFSPYGGGWSNYFDGDGDFLSIALATGAYSLGTADFTVEMWINIPSYKTGLDANTVMIAAGSNSLSFYITNAGKLAISQWGVAILASSAATLQLNNWNHIAVSRQGTALRLFINGALDGTATSSASLTGSSATQIGQDPGASANTFLGYISNLRVVKGTAVYTTNFTPATAPLTPITGTSLLTCADNRFVDDSINNFAITRNGDVRVEKFNPFGIQTAMTPVSHGAFFDGNGDFLSVPNNTAFNISANFTIEMWIYPTLLSGVKGLFGQRASEANYCPILMEFSGATLLFFVSTSGSSWTVTLTSPSLTVNTWTHIALVRSGTTVSYYINGVAGGSTGTATGALMTPVATAYIGADSGTPSGAGYFPGYISNFRIVNGTAVYTANFTPITTPLTAIANTSLLTCQSPTFVDNSTNRFAITANGNTQPLPVNPFGFTAGAKTSYTPAVFGGSMYFDGTGDFLTSPGNVAFNLSAGSWTVECWFYQTSSKQVQLFSSGSARWRLDISTGQQVVWLFNTSSFVTSTNTAPLNQWNHVAVCFNGTFFMYLNGVAQSVIPGGLVPGSDNTSVLYIGRNVDAGSGWDFNGYITDVRIVRGAALYTSNFVLPAQPLQPVAGTTLLLNGTSAAIYDASMSNNLETVGDARNVTNIVRYGNTSMFFDGTGDYLLAPTNPNFSFGTGNFTVEVWVNFSALAANRPIADCWVSGGAGAWQLYYTNTTGKIVWYVNASTIVSSTTTPLVNTWYHVAVARSGSTVKIFINGVEEGSATHTTNLTHTRPLAVGIQHSTLTNPLNGYISDLRITKGVARYTANFTPPTTAHQTR